MESLFDVSKIFPHEESVFEMYGDWVRVLQLNCSLNGIVEDSMTREYYSVEVKISGDGKDIEKASCECLRGEQKHCHHMASLLIKLNKKIPSKGSQPIPAVRETYNKELRLTTKLKVPTIDQIIEELKSDVDTTRDRKQLFLEKIIVSSSDIEWVKSNTLGQSLTPLWKYYRKGRLTASNFGRILIQLERGTFPVSFWKQLMGEYNIEHIPAVKWGLDHRDDGKKKYVEKTRNTVEECGLQLHENGILGASPNGLVDDDRIVQIKCPYLARNLSISEAVDNPPSKAGFYIKRKGTSYILNTKHPQGKQYFAQIQGCLYLTKRRFCDLVVWTPEDCIILTIEKDESWSSNIDKLIQFYKDHYFDKLISR